MEPFICIHGHFYQPPRENPWLEDIELQDSAYPFHDWNERIAVECYAPNGVARILDGEGRIGRIVNNYGQISFNVGPTLLSWLEKHRPDAYLAILDADRTSRQRFTGHGSAIAQGYNHMIMPLANSRDKATQVAWGLGDFRRRFGREPEGMWLPETAVDLETLEILAGEGIAYTILAPHQAARIRPLGEKRWQDVSGGKVDPRIPYRCPLPSGKSIDLFFYDGPLAQDIAFGGLLSDGENFLQRLVGNPSGDSRPELVHVATDGETYGHHHRFGEMALAYCLDQIERRKLARITNYGEFLATYPPAFEVQIAENTSWSCAHGVERWRSDCGCHIGGKPGWTQAWRAPLRAALDWLRDELVLLFEKEAGSLFADPWKARDAYIEVLLDRSPETVRAFFQAQAGRALNPEEEVRALRLLELQRQAMLMYTSCGWFFDEVSGIETTQILAYAGRAVQLAEEACGVHLEDGFVQRLSEVPSNDPRKGDGGRIYRDLVGAIRLDLPRVAAHHAIVAGFGGTETEGREVYCYSATNCEQQDFPGGRMKLTVGRTCIRSAITWNEEDFSFAVLNLGGHNVNAGVRRFAGGQAFAALSSSLSAAFGRSDIPGVIRLMDQHFGSSSYSLWHLFRDEQRRVLRQVMAQPLEQVAAAFETIYADNFTLLRFLRGIGMPIPAALQVPAEQVLTGRLRDLLENGPLHPRRLYALAEEVEKLGLTLDDPMLPLAAGRQLLHQMEKLSRTPRNMALLLTIIETLEVLQAFPLEVDLWKAQNLYWETHHALIPLPGGENGEWQESFLRLGDLLQVRVS
jgi:alpha-amylase/alpha-mannosidase (GH57 family)